MFYSKAERRKLLAWIEIMRIKSQNIAVIHIIIFQYLVLFKVGLRLGFLLLQISI